MSDFLHIRVGMQTYLFRKTLLHNKKSSMLSRFAKMSHQQRLKLVDNYNEKKNQYCFNRRISDVFDTVFEYYLNGKFHRPLKPICPLKYAQEIAFWKAERFNFSPCCRDFSQKQSKLAKRRRTRLASLHKIMYDPFQGVIFSTVRRQIWFLFTKPAYSRIASFLNIISTLFVLISIAGLIFGSMPEFQITVIQDNCTNVTQESSAIRQSEYICVSWFTFEYFVKFLVTPERLTFVRSPMNLIDLLTFVPFHLELLLELFQVDTGLGHVSNLMAVLRVLRVMRAARVLKLARYSNQMQSFGGAFRNSFEDLLTLSVFLITGMVLFATVMWSVEKDVNPDFDNILNGCWWAVQTMIPIGFGDAVPKTIAGQLVASLTSVSGIVVLSIPISLIANIWRIHFKRQFRNNELGLTPRLTAIQEIEDEEFEQKLSATTHLPTVLV